VVAILLLPLAIAAMLVACQSQPTCSGNLHEYNGMCLTNTAIVYMECTKGRGFDQVSELGGSLGGTFKVVADASVELAYKKAQTENKEVSLQIVSDCLKLAEAAADSPAEQSVAEQYQQTADKYMQAWRKTQVAETPHIEISPTEAQVGETVRVSGSNYYANETIAIRLHATLVKQVKADGEGTFDTTIAVPKNAPPPGFPTTITATGTTSAKSAEASFDVLQ
jgi:hypothetical protein